MIRPDIKIPVITGPTASGKSEAAMFLCEMTGGELISCDSMQIYKGLDIGTAKASYEEQRRVRHHMIDIVEPGVNYSVSSFLADCYASIENVLEKGKLPVLCGGTGQYISALYEGLKFEDDPDIDKISDELYKEYDESGIGMIYERLKKVDPEAVLDLHPNNTRRVIRALAAFEATGKTKKQRNLDSRKEGPRYNFLLFEINYEDNRSILYDRINSRVDRMMDMGLYDEASYLYSLPIDRRSTCCQAIGYKEFLPLIDGLTGISLDKVIYDIKLNTRHFAKRQLTWFRYMKDICMIDRDLSSELQAEFIKSFII